MNGNYKKNNEHGFVTQGSSHLQLDSHYPLVKSRPGKECWHNIFKYLNSTLVNTQNCMGVFIKFSFSQTKGSNIIFENFPPRRVFDSEICRYHARNVVLHSCMSSDIICFVLLHEYLMPRVRQTFNWHGITIKTKLYANNILTSDV